MLRRIECRLNFKNWPVRTRDIKGGPKQPPFPLIGVARSLPLIGLTLSSANDAQRTVTLAFEFYYRQHSPCLTFAALFHKRVWPLPLLCTPLPVTHLTWTPGVHRTTRFFAHFAFGCFIPKLHLCTSILTFGATCVSRRIIDGDTCAEKFESLERINSIRETNGSFDTSHMYLM